MPIAFFFFPRQCRVVGLPYRYSSDRAIGWWSCMPSDRRKLLPYPGCARRLAAPHCTSGICFRCFSPQSRAQVGLPCLHASLPLAERVFIFIGHGLVVVVGNCVGCDGYRTFAPELAVCSAHGLSMFVLARLLAVGSPARVAAVVRGTCRKVRAGIFDSTYPFRPWAHIPGLPCLGISLLGCSPGVP